MNIIITDRSKNNDVKLSFPGRRERGVLLVELMVAMCIIVIGILAMLGSFALFATLSAKTGNRVYAEILAKSMMDRIRAHRYGDPEPYNWSTGETLKILPDVTMSEALAKKRSGKQKSSVTYLTFNKKVEYENGSFIGKTTDNYDVITITIGWSEKDPGHQFEKKGEKKAESRLRVVTEVRRNIPDQKDGTN